VATESHPTSFRTPDEAKETHTTMSVTVYMELNAREGKVGELKALLEMLLPDSRAAQGCRQISVHQDMDRPTRIVMLESWDRRADHEAYMEWRLQRGDSTSVRTLYSEPPRCLYLESVEG
jgi:quinol monooxygenase YgiN